jgi:hypothetical protein
MNLMSVKNRKRLPKRDPMTAEIYKELIKAAEGPTYINYGHE